jgi:hypothetical protein
MNEKPDPKQSPGLREHNRSLGRMQVSATRIVGKKNQWSVASQLRCQPLFKASAGDKVVATYLPAGRTGCTRYSQCDACASTEWDALQRGGLSGLRDQGPLMSRRPA